MEELKPINIQSTLERQQPSIKNGVWLATWKEESTGMNWFKHCGPGKINAARSTLLAIQTYTMVNNKLPSFVCHYGWAFSKDTQGFYEITKIIENDMHIKEKYHTPEDEVSGILGNDRNISCATSDSFTQEFNADCLDHTAYGITKMCAEMNIDFRCYKHLSKHRPYHQHDEWLEDCTLGAKKMHDMCANKFGDIPNG
jgi:hypothetical protein